MKNITNMTNFHKLLFWSSAVPITFFLILFEYMNIFDSAFILYSLSFFLSTAILVFWIYWYIKSTRRSVIFIINGLLIFSMWYRTGFDLYSRFYFIIGDFETYKKVITSDLWSYRVGIQLAVLLWLLTWIASRIFRGEEYFRGYKDEPDDHYFDTSQEVKLNVLVVDDEEAVVTVIRDQIKFLESYEIYTATTLENGMSLFKERRYFLILLDLRFKGKSINDVIDFCKQIRELDRFVFLVIVTGYIEQAYNFKLLNYIDDVISKPFNLEFLKGKLLSWAMRYRRRIFYIKDLSLKVDCVKNTIVKMLNEQGRPVDSVKKGDDFYD